MSYNDNLNLRRYLVSYNNKHKIDILSSPVLLEQLPSFVFFWKKKKLKIKLLYVEIWKNWPRNWNHGTVKSWPEPDRLQGQLVNFTHQSAFTGFEERKCIRGKSSMKPFVACNLIKCWSHWSSSFPLTGQYWSGIDPVSLNTGYRLLFNMWRMQNCCFQVV